MATITQGNSATATLTETDVVSLSASGGAQGQVSVVSSTGKLRYSSAFSDMRNIGPFSAGDVLTITAVRGSITYAVAPYAGSPTTVTVFEGSSATVGVAG